MTDSGQALLRGASRLRETMVRVEVADVEFLLTSEGRRLLDAGDAAYDDDALVAAARLRQRFPLLAAPLAAVVLTQATLRRAARRKFGAAAARMLFTPSGLEQATHPAVAAYRAERATVAGPEALLDMGCGIGSDLIAFAHRGFAVTGVEADAVTARIAAANLETLGLPGRVLTAAAEAVEVRPFDLVFADPSRRSTTGRLFDPEAFSPPWPFVAALLTSATKGDGPRRAVVKLSPGLDHALIPDGAEAEWISIDGELKEVALWSPAQGAARRRATVIGADGTATSCDEADLPVDGPPVHAVGAYLYEPDPAVIRSHLVSVVAARVDGWLLDPHLAYVSSDTEVSTPLARGFRVREVLPFKEKALRAALRARDVGSITIKKRGVSVTPEELRRRLALHGSRPATLVLTRTPRSAVALLVDPLP